MFQDSRVKKMYDQAVKNQMKNMGNDYLKSVSKSYGLGKLDRTKQWMRVKKENRGMPRKERTKKMIHKINALEKQAKLKDIQSKHIRNAKGSEDFYLQAVYAKLDLLKSGGYGNDKNE